ncbi:MAG: hypothetical protein ACOYBY_12830 [Dermatophilaceae bacterium]
MTLREQIQTEIEIHELLLSLGRNESLLNYLGRLEEDFSHADSLTRDGLSAEARRSLHIPPGVSFKADPDARSLTDMTMLVKHKTWLIEISWDGQDGLTVRPLEGHRGTTSASLSLETSDQVRSLDSLGEET